MKETITMLFIMLVIAFSLGWINREKVLLLDVKIEKLDNKLNIESNKTDSINKANNYYFNAIINNLNIIKREQDKIKRGRI